MRYSVKNKYTGEIIRPGDPLQKYIDYIDLLTSEIYHLKQQRNGMKSSKAQKVCTDEQIAAIRIERANGATLKDLANKYSCSSKTISRYVAGIDMDCRKTPKK